MMACRQAIIWTNAGIQDKAVLQTIGKKQHK